ncbi:glutathione binding-like protein [Veronia nyctiphanis]|uniref:glutathione binding-like protein n=1 Tax=Veronia nyctiphanis TaxID=1278244 RepID=UPI00137616DD|nr:glutathione binding-like protein [Veronia nyctiphanis]
MPKTSRRTLGWTIATEIIHPWLGRPAGWWFSYRQLNEWLWKDGVNRKNTSDVRDMLFREFEFLEPLLEEQPFIMGSHPSVADYGYFASMFRHFGNDPVSAETMRMQAPNTYEWLARLWNAKPDKLSAEQIWHEPTQPFWLPMLDRIANDYLPYLKQNAEAYLADQKRFDFAGKSLQFNGTKATAYRVWCYCQLQKAFHDLSKEHKEKVRTYFNDVEGFDQFVNAKVIDVNMDQNYMLPWRPKDQKRPGFTPSIWIFGQPRN